MTNFAKTFIQKNMKYGIIGVGAIGGYYGGMLAKAGKDVHFLFHGDYSVACRHGLQIDSYKGNFHLDDVQAYRQATDMPPCDVVLVCLKSTRQHLLRELLPPLLHDDTLVVLIQNGIGLEEDVQRIFPTVQLVAGLAFICVDKVAPAHIRHQQLGRINFGNFSCRDEARLLHLVADFTAAGIEAQAVDYLTARWQKAIWNMPFNGMTVALNTTTSGLLAHPATERLLHRQMLEVIRAARRLGVRDFDDRLADKMLAMTKAMQPYLPSMKLDHDFGRPMEIDYLYTRPIAQAKAAGEAMPCLEMLEAQLRFIEAARPAKEA